MVRKTKLIKILILRHINDHKPLVHNACRNEMYCFEKYLLQVKSNYETLDLNRLESLVKRPS